MDILAIVLVILETNTLSWAWNSEELVEKHRSDYARDKTEASQYPQDCILPFVWVFNN